MPSLSDTITPTKGKPGKTADTAADAIWHASQFTQDAKLSLNGKPDHTPLSKTPDAGELIGQENEILRPDGTRSYFTTVFTKDSDGKLWSKSYAADGAPEFAHDWREDVNE